MRLRSRSLVALLAVLAATIAPATSSQANPVNSFIDDDNSRFEPFIETAHAEGLVNGCNPPDNDLVCPHHLVSRGSMAIMLSRALGLASSNGDHFSDDNGHVAEGAIDALIDAGVQMRCGENRVCPDRTITRGEMAALITRSFTWDRATNPDKFTDIADSPFRNALAKLADRDGLLTCDPPVNERLCPDEPVRRDEAIYALVSVMGLSPAVTSPQDVDIAPLGFGDGFDELTLWDGRSPSARNRLSLTDDGFHETALRVRIPKGSHFGADFHLHLDDAAKEPPEQLFFRYYVKFDKDWRTKSSGKLPGFSGVYGASGKGGYRSSSTDPGWSARLMFRPNDRTDDRIDLGYYVYHLGQERRYGDGLKWNEAGKLRAGEWYCLEGEVQLNSLGLPDGALRAWVDETPALDISGLEFRRPSEPEIKIESFWFNVYYGGKPVAPQNLGLTIDEVMVDTTRIGCGAGNGISGVTQGDFDGDGYQDRARWRPCAGGHCFMVERPTSDGLKSSRRGGEGAWFSLNSHRHGMAIGDFDGDGRSDLGYHGRCDRSAPCWRVHSGSGGLVDGANWGSGARFSGEPTPLIAGDWNGDGYDDIVYRGLCGDDGRDCWRSHLSAGSSFEGGADWGPLPPPELAPPIASDLNGDGLDDLLFQAPCEESACWYSQTSNGSGFDPPQAMGAAAEAGENVEWIDFDGDGTRDVVSWFNSTDYSWIEVRYSASGRLTTPVRLAEFDSEIRDLAMRQRDRTAPVQAVVTLTCEDGGRCVETLASPSPDRLVAVEEFRDARWDRPGAAEID